MTACASSTSATNDIPHIWCRSPERLGDTLRIHREDLAALLSACGTDEEAPVTRRVPSGRRDYAEFFGRSP